MTITPEEVAKLAAAATPGPWQWGEYTADGIAGVLEPYMCQGEGFVEVSEPDAAFIAAAHDMADLIARQDEAHAENARILGYLVNELQGLIPAGKLAALEKCRERSAAFTATREKLK